MKLAALMRGHNIFLVEIGENYLTLISKIALIWNSKNFLFNFMQYWTLLPKRICPLTKEKPKYLDIQSKMIKD